MNNIRGLSQSIAHLNPGGAHEARNAGEGARSQKDANAFETFLSGLSQASGKGETTQGDRQAALGPMLPNEQLPERDGDQSRGAAPPTGRESPRTMLPLSFAEVAGEFAASESRAPPGTGGASPADRRPLGRDEQNPAGSASRSGKPVGTSPQSLARAASNAPSVLPTLSANSRIPASTSDPNTEPPDVRQAGAPQLFANEAAAAIRNEAAAASLKLQAPIPSGADLGAAQKPAVRPQTAGGAASASGSAKDHAPANAPQHARGAEDSGQGVPAPNPLAIAFVPVFVPASPLPSGPKAPTPRVPAAPASLVGSAKDGLAAEESESGAPRRADIGLWQFAGATEDSRGADDENTPARQFSPSVAARPVEMKADVLSTATHLAPVTRLSPIQQIAGFIAASMPAPGHGPAAPAENSAPAVPTSFDPQRAAIQPSAGVVKTLDLQLEPASLGQVTVRLDLSGGGLDIKMQADRSEAVNLIEKEKQTLSDQLRQSGYAVAGLEIRLAGPASAAAQFSNAAGYAASGDGRASGGSTRGDGSAHDSSARDPQGPPGTSPQDNSPRRRSADLYV